MKLTVVSTKRGDSFRFYKKDGSVYFSGTEEACGDTTFQLERDELEELIELAQDARQLFSNLPKTTHGKK